MKATLCPKILLNDFVDGCTVQGLAEAYDVEPVEIAKAVGRYADQLNRGYLR